MKDQFTLLMEDEKAQLYRLETEPFGTNAYIVVCRAGGESLLVDAPGSADLLKAKLGETVPQMIVITHGHMDHLLALEELSGALGVDVAAHRGDAAALPVQPGRLLEDGERISVGRLSLEVIHTPGHTPGGICLLLDGILLSGDTIFPGGPGKTASPEDFSLVLESIAKKIMALDDGTVIYPGHGGETTVGRERALFEKFMAGERNPMLCGDVSWSGE